MVSAEVRVSPAQPGDLDRALDMYQLLAAGGDDEEMLFTVLEGPPPSKARPRFGKGKRVYSTAEMRAAEEKTSWQIKRAMHGRGPMTGNVSLGCVFFRPNLQRIDADNLLKHICDAANGVLWIDDSQVTAVLGMVELDRDNPRTIMVVGKHTSTLKRGTDGAYPCAVCEKPILPSDSSGKNSVTCSPACATIRKGYKSLAVEIPCPQCGVMFRRKTAAQKLCSETCRADSMTGRNRLRAVPRSRCLDCDAQLAHHRGGRCRGCWRASLKAHVSSLREFS